MRVKILCDEKDCPTEFEFDTHAVHMHHALPIGWSSLQLHMAPRERTAPGVLKIAPGPETDVAIGPRRVPGAVISKTLAICPSCTEKRLGGLPFEADSNDGLLAI